MVDPQTSRFWQAALQSGLVDVAGLKACWEALPPDKRVADQIDRRVARQAVQGNLLTLWQAQQLLAGRSTGFKIDRYILLEMIGQGGMGRVYLARDSRLNRRVALKILSPERVNNPRAIARFQREARVGAQLQHENLVRIYDEGESNGKCYLVMEYIEGKNIGTIIAENGPMPPSTAARLCRQVALGLEHAQQKGLIHRDVNPYNILVTRDGTAKLTDLGLAIDLGDAVPVTRDGATVGTFDYVSPEQARHSHSVDTRSDIYSLGCTLYHMIAGQVPFPSPSLPEKLFGHQAVEPESLTSLVPGVPEGLVEVVRKMMRKSPDDRYASPLELAQALEPYVDEQAPAFRDDPSSTSAGAIRATQTATKITAARRAPLPGVTEMATPASATILPPPVATPLPQVPSIPGPSPEPDRSGLAAEAPGLGIEPSRAEAPVPQDRSPAPAPDPEALPDFLRIGGEEAPREDLSGLGLALNFGAEAPPSEAASKPKARAKPATPPAPAPGPAPSAPAAAAPTPPPAAPASAPPPVPESEPALDFSKLGGEAPPREDFSGLGLGLDLGPEPPLSEGAGRPKARAKPAPAASVPPPAPAPAPAPPRVPEKAKPVAPPPVPAAEAPASAPEAEPAFDFSKLGGEVPPKDDFSGLGLGLGLDLGPSPSEASSKPKAKARPTPAAESPTAAIPTPPAAPPPAPEKTKPVPPPPPPPTPVPSAPRRPPEPESEPAFDFSKLGGEAAPKDDFSGLGLGLDLGPGPSPSEAPAKPKAKPAPPPPKARPAEVPAPAAEKAKAPAPAAPPPPPAAPPPDFSRLGGEAPPKEDLSGLGLGLDFGPEPPLSTTPRARPAPPAAPAPVAAPAPDSSQAPAAEAPKAKAKAVSAGGPDRRLILGGAAALVVIGATVGLFASGVLGKSGKPAAPTARKAGTSKPTTAVASLAKPEAPRVPQVQKAQAPEVPKGKPIVVRAGDGTETEEPTLKDAMLRAIGSRGSVLLNNPEPLRFSGEAAELSIGGNPLYIRAKEGAQPVIEVEIKGNRPFITARSDTPITMVGVTIVARYTGQVPESPPVIEAGGNITLTNCSFSASGAVKGSRAVMAEGGALTAKGCWFEGFDKALDVACFGGSTTKVTQCMMVRARSDDQPIGWGLRLRSMPGGFAKDRSLVLDHCTVKGKGLLDLVEFSPDASITVRLNDCAVLVDALLAWEGKAGVPPNPETLKPNPESLKWEGRGNQYDVRGKSWVVLSAQGAPEMAGGPTDLASWSKIGKESDTLPPPVRFQNDSSTAPRPQDFAVQDQGPRSPGADPNRVGPSAKGK